ncbi:MAG: M24 family metallopeptidase [Desulfobacteraceae bacterium]|nr:M24 family metallopeptidase [Desulfobacteraceae bacterium]
MDLIKSKIDQTFDLLKDLDIDLWMIFCRESEIMTDPSLAMMVGAHVSAQAAFMFTKTGCSRAIVWKYDAENIQRTGYFDEVEIFTTDFKEVFNRAIAGINPRQIAVNYSLTSSTADGISYGMYLKLKDYLKETPYKACLISAEEFLLKLRSRKTEPEIEKLRIAATISELCWQEALPEIKTGMTEIEIAALIAGRIKGHGGVQSFPSIVNAGAKTSPGHGLPTTAVLEPGDLLHVDFGAEIDGYCADLQRLAYFLKPGESSAPDVLRKAFNKIKEIVDVSAIGYTVGARGIDIDKAARQMLTAAGYEEYQHSLGHQIGRAVHDGGSRVGPKYEEHDRTPFIPLEAGNAFTVELGVALENIGYVGLEEDLVVTTNGGEFLCNRQTELPVK